MVVTVPEVDLGGYDVLCCNMYHTYRFPHLCLIAYTWLYNIFTTVIPYFHSLYHSCIKPFDITVLARICPPQLSALDKSQHAATPLHWYIVSSAAAYVVVQSCSSEHRLILVPVLPSSAACCDRPARSGESLFCRPNQLCFIM